MIPLVSILIPAYNAENWIKDAAKSALDQTWSKKEIIIVDDGSSDNTLHIAREFESESVKVITQANMGASAARNKALSLAQGDYIQWLDADDLLAPNKISQQLKMRHKEGSARILFSSAWCKMFFRLKKAKMATNLLWKDLDPIEWIITKFNENAWMANSSFLISRKLTEMAGPWDEKLSLDDDGEYFCRVVCNSEKVLFVPDAISYYRQCNIKSLNKSRTDEACKSLFLSYRKCIGHILTLEDSERTRNASLKYLQRWLYHFYPEKPVIYPEENELLQELLKELNKLAKELGGVVLPPDLGLKYNLIKKIFGWETTLQLMNIPYYFKQLAFMDLDKFLYNLSSMFFPDLPKTNDYTRHG